MGTTHDWHPFDTERGYEVRQVDEFTWELRSRHNKQKTWRLNPAQFDQLREAGENPLDIP